MNSFVRVCVDDEGGEAPVDTPNILLHGVPLYPGGHAPFHHLLLAPHTRTGPEWLIHSREHPQSRSTGYNGPLQRGELTQIRLSIMTDDLMYILITCMLYM